MSGVVLTEYQWIKILNFIEGKNLYKLQGCLPSFRGSFAVNGTKRRLLPEKYGKWNSKAFYPMDLP